MVSGSLFVNREEIWSPMTEIVPCSCYDDPALEYMLDILLYLLPPPYPCPDSMDRTRRPAQSAFSSRLQKIPTGTYGIEKPHGNNALLDGLRRFSWTALMCGAYYGD